MSRRGALPASSTPHRGRPQRITSIDPVICSSAAARFRSARSADRHAAARLRPARCAAAVPSRTARTSSARPPSTAEILEAARTLGDGRSPFVFASQGGKPFSITRLPWLLQNLKIAAVPHGFRSSFRDWAAEETNHPREVVEAALAHVVATTGPRRHTRGRTCSSAGGA